MGKRPRVEQMIKQRSGEWGEDANVETAKEKLSYKGYAVEIIDHFNTGRRGRRLCGN